MTIPRDYVATDVWVVCRVLGGEREGQIEINGVCSTLENALLACTDDQTHAARFTLDADYRQVFDFVVVSRANPEPTMTRTGEPSE